MNNFAVNKIVINYYYSLSQDIASSSEEFALTQFFFFLGSL